MSEWIEWNGGDKCPTPSGADVSVRFRAGDVTRDRAPELWLWGRWSGFARSEIVAYQVHEDVAPTSAGDSHQATTFHALPVVDVMKPEPAIGAGEAVRRDWDRPGYDTERASEPGLAINPKDAIGSTKLPLDLWPAEATAMGCLGMLEGAEKYGRNNFVAGEGVIASIYVDAAKRHLDAWFAGEEHAHDTGTPHLANALATIAILVKCQAHGKMIDDRDYSPEPNGAAYRRFIESLTPHVKRIKEMFKGKNPRHFTIADVKQ